MGKSIPLNSLVITVGPCKAGKSYLCEKYFPKHEIEDYSKIKNELVGFQNNRPDIKNEIKSFMLTKLKSKLSLGERVVIDDVNIFDKDRNEIAKLGFELNIPVFYLVVNRDLDDKISEFPRLKNIIEKQEEIFKKNEYMILYGDGIAEVIDTRSHDFNVITKPPLNENLTSYIQDRFSGITVVPDIHGSLEALKSSINWSRKCNNFMIFLGDLINYGPKSIECVENVYDIITRGQGIFILGNHEEKLIKYLDGLIPLEKLNRENMHVLDALEQMSENHKRKWIFKFKSLYYMGVTHLILKNYIFVHAAINKEIINLGNVILKGKLRKLVTQGMNDLKNIKDEKPEKLYDWIDDIPYGYNIIIGHDTKSVIKPIDYIYNNVHIYFLDTGSGKGGVLTTADLKFNDKNELYLSHFNRY